MERKTECIKFYERGVGRTFFQKSFPHVLLAYSTDNAINEPGESLEFGVCHCLACFDSDFAFVVFEFSGEDNEGAVFDLRFSCVNGLLRACYIVGGEGIEGDHAVLESAPVGFGLPGAVHDGFDVVILSR